MVNGLGSAVASVLALHAPTPLEMVGVADEFGEVGQVDYLAERFELTAAEIVSKVKKVIQSANTMVRGKLWKVFGAKDISLSVMPLHFMPLKLFSNI